MDANANNSPHMRTACMQARVEHASPALLRAFTSATYAFGGQIYDMAFAPLHAIGFAGMLSLIGALPWLTTIRNAFGWIAPATKRMQSFTSASQDINETNTFPEHTVYVLKNGERATQNRRLSQREVCPSFGRGPRCRLYGTLYQQCPTTGNAQRPRR